MAISMALLGLNVLCNRKQKIEWDWLAGLIAIFSLFPLIQIYLGVIELPGSGWMASLYLLGFSLSMVCGRSLMKAYGPHFIQWVAGVVLAGSILSVGIALCQWLDLRGLYWVIDLIPGGRPYANFGQPNHLATLLFWGLISALLAFHCEMIGRIGLLIVVFFLGVGVAATQSRAGLLECALLGIGLLLMQRKTGFQVRWWLPLSCLLLLVGLSLSWGQLSQALLMSGSIAAGDRLTAGTRPMHWAMLIDAVGRSPWLGYGWDQVAKAHLLVALDYPAVSEWQEHSHNLILDLLIWNGVLLGGVLVGAIFYWFWQNFKMCRTPVAASVLMAIGGVFLHGLLEYPLEYAYFLFPTGLMMGALGYINSPQGGVVAGSKRVFSVPYGVCLVLFSIVWIDYSKVEENYRELRFQSAGIGGFSIKNEVPDIILLTQLRGLLWVARSNMSPEMSMTDLMRVRAVALRYPFPPVLMQFALANGLNNRPREAEVVLQTLCKRYERRVCESSIGQWQKWAQEKYPVLDRIRLPADRGVVVKAGVVQ